MVRAWKLAALVVTATAVSALATTADAAPFTIRVTIENLAPARGNLLTPVWIGFHDGTFDLFNQGEVISPALERLAEDGNTAPLSAMFAAAPGARADGTSFGPSGPIAPGQSTTSEFVLDSRQLTYFSYASMVIPSNDAFIANGNPRAFQLFDGSGRFGGVDVTVLGRMVWDAGSEVNDEIPMNTAAFGQASPDTGVAENGVVSLHPGFMPRGSGGILDDEMFASADFTEAGYQIARITVTATPVPEPASMGLLALGLAVLGRRVHRRASGRRP